MRETQGGDPPGRSAAWRQIRPDLDTASVALASALIGAGARIAHGRKVLFDRFDLGDRGFDVLLALWQAGGGASRTVGQVARSLPGGPISSGGATFVVDRLARGGLVERTPHPEDRRAVLVSLTERGEATAAAVMQALVSAEGQRLSVLAPALRQDLLAALDRIATGPREPFGLEAPGADAGVKE